MTKILRKTCSSLVKIISDGLNNFAQNKYSKLQKISAKNKRYFFAKNKCKYGIIYSSITRCRPDGLLWSRLNFITVIPYYYYFFLSFFILKDGIYYIDIYSKCVTYLYIFLLFCPKSIHLLTFMGVVEVASFLSP